MSRQQINYIQDFLTVFNEKGDKKHRIVNIESLFKNHSSIAVIKFLEQLHREYSKRLKRIIRRDITSHRLNDVIAKKFRIKMAINTIRNYSKQGGKAA